MDEKRSRLLKSTMLWSGRAIGVAGILFVIFRLSEYFSEIEFDRLGPSFWAVFFVLTLVYGFSGIALARAWWLLLTYSGGRIEWILALQIYGESAIAKYVPGNVFQIAGRQALGNAAGIRGGALAKSAAVEIFLLAFVGILFGALVAPVYFSDYHSASVPFLFVFIFATAMVVVAVLTSRLVLRAALWQASFLLMSGLVFVAMYTQLGDSPHDMGRWPFMCGSFVVAWLAGFLTPGSPAGLGVREIVLIFLLGRYVPEAQLLLAVLLTRAVTALGDVLFWLGAIWIGRAKPNPTPGRGG